MPARPVFSVMLLSEDGSHRAGPTLKSLLKHVFRFIDERCQTHRIDFQPPTDRDVQHILIANQWSDRRRSERVKLYRFLSTQLDDADAFVIHHIDADRRWSERDSDPPVHVTRVPTEVLAHVRTILSKKYSDAEIDERLQRYLLLVPYWELEAWLYQHTAVAERLCREHPSCRGSHAALLAEWRDDRSKLDDCEDPEALLRPCVGKQHNEALAGPGYPIKDVVAADTSLAAAVHEFFHCEPLLDALARTYAPPP